MPGAVGSGALEATEKTIVAVVRWIELGVETIGVLVAVIGVVLAIGRMVRHYSETRSGNFDRVRLTLGKYLALALEFQLGADILATAVAPSWEQIGQLGAIAAIRTLLNYFLNKELEVEIARTAQTGEAGREAKTE